MAQLATITEQQQRVAAILGSHFGSGIRRFPAVVDWRSDGLLQASLDEYRGTPVVLCGSSIVCCWIDQPVLNTCVRQLRCHCILGKVRPYPTVSLIGPTEPVGTGVLDRGGNCPAKLFAGSPPPCRRCYAQEFGNQPRCRAGDDFETGGVMDRLMCVEQSER